MKFLRPLAILSFSLLVAAGISVDLGSNVAYAQCEGNESVYEVSYSTACGVIVDGYGATGSGCVTIAHVTYWGDYATISDDAGMCTADESAGAFINVSPESITRGASAELSWGSSGVSSCSIDQGIGSVAPNGAGARAVSPSTTTTYTITCQGTYGQTVSDTATLAVTDPPVLPTVSLIADPSSITSGSASTLRWSSENATSCSIDNGVGTVSPNVSGTSPVSPTVTTTYALTCTGTGGSRSAYATVAVTQPTYPDLTAGSVSATNARLGQAGTLSAPIQNIGTAAAGTSYAYYQVVAPNSKGNAASVISVGALVASASQTASAGYTFSYEGLYEARFCADWYGAVAESNEANNCGPWVEIDVRDTTVSVDTVGCLVSDTQVNVGETVTYTAAPNGSARAPYTWYAPDGASGFGSGTVVHRTFTQAGTYAMQVSATGASNNPAQCEPVTVGVGMCPAGNEDLSITASPLRVREGQTSTVTWSATGVSGMSANCTVTGPGINWDEPVSAPPQCSVADSETVTINSQSTYTLTCDNATPVSVTVNVIPNFQEF